MTNTEVRSALGIRSNRPRAIGVVIAVWTMACLAIAAWWLRDRLLAEIKGVVERINVAIQTYGHTAQDLTFDGTAAKPVKKSSVKSLSAAAKFQDGAGNTWTGRRPRPQWIRDALAAGASIDSFRVSGVSPAEVVRPGRDSKRAGVKRPAKYRDPATGATWSGGGSQPVWLRTALASGKTLADFAVDTSASAAPPMKKAKTKAPRTKKVATSKTT